MVLYRQDVYRYFTISQTNKNKQEQNNIIFSKISRYQIRKLKLTSIEVPTISEFQNSRIAKSVIFQLAISIIVAVNCCLHVDCCTDMKVTGLQIASDIEAVQEVNCSIMADRIVSGVN